MTRRWLLILIVGAAIAWGGGCGKSDPIDGTYHDGTGLMAFKFHSGHCDVTVAGRTITYTSEKSGNTVTIRPEVGRNPMVFTIQADGSMVEQGTGNKIAR